jgi:hypothetical protein
MKKLFVLALLGLVFCGACTQTQPRPISAIYAVYAVDSLGNNIFPFDSILYPKGYLVFLPKSGHLKFQSHEKAAK